VRRAKVQADPIQRHDESGGDAKAPALAGDANALLAQSEPAFPAPCFEHAIAAKRG
jgi:hypothetical protein